MTSSIIKALLISVTVSMLLSFVIPSVIAGPAAGTASVLSSLRTHDVIAIDGNDDMISMAASEGWPGNGTESSPYLIEGYDIDAFGHAAGISISNVTLYLTIFNCTVSDGQGDGILLISVENVTVAENTMAGHRGSGIIIFGSNNCSLISNIVIDSLWGICLDGCRDMTVLTNTLKNDGYGIYLTSSNNVTVRTNFMDSGFFCVYLSDADDNVIHGNEIYNSADGISLWGGSDRNVLSNNSAEGCYCGIYLNGDRDNQIIGNTLDENTFGIDLDGAYDDIITDNEVRDSVSYGIRLMGGSAGNCLYKNVLVGNNVATDVYDADHVQAYDGGDNDWNYGEQGNHWGDWTSPDADGDGMVDEPYSIGNAADEHPFVSEDMVTGPVDEEDEAPRSDMGVVLAVAALMAVVALVALLVWRKGLK